MRICLVVMMILCVLGAGTHQCFQQLLYTTPGIIYFVYTKICIEPFLWNLQNSMQYADDRKLFIFFTCLELLQNYILVNRGKVFGGYWKEVHRVENVYVNLALHSIREMAALTRLRIFQHQNLN